MKAAAPEASHEVLSSFADGECTEFESRLAVRRLVESEEARHKLERYQLIGAVLREEHLLQADPAFADRVMARLRPLEVDHAPEPAPHEVPAAMHARYWRPAAGVALAATVAVATVLGVRALTRPDQGVQVASQDGQLVTPGGARPERSAVSLNSSPEITDYLVHHAEFAPMRGTLPYARVVGYDVPAR